MNELALDITSPEPSYEIFETLLPGLSSFKTFLDVGCGHGKYSIIASRYFKVTGVDARPDRVPFNHKGIDWKIQHVKDIEVTQDIVLLSGILYHLTLQDQINLVKKCSAAKVVIINTHIIEHENGSILNVYKRDKLSAIHKVNGYEGSLYHEGTNLKNRPMASFDNEYSFWHTEQSLIKLMAGWNLARVDPRVMEGRYFYYACKHSD
jgi:SAM-dependent methyltransferase